MSKLRPPRPPSEPPAPPRVDDGIVGKVRSVGKLRGAGPARGDRRRATVEKVRSYLGSNAPPTREVRRSVSDSIYGDDDESEN